MMSDREETPEPPSPGLAVSITVRDARAAIEWYERVFKAKNVLSLTAPGGTVAHAELQIGDGLVYLADPAPTVGDVPPEGGTARSTRIHLYVADVEEVLRLAASEGASVVIPVADQFYGDRAARLLDPFGHVWIVATRVESVRQVERQKRMERLFSGGPFQRMDPRP